MPVPDFSPGEVLTAAAMDSIGLWLIETKTVTTAGVLDFTSVFTANYSGYRLIFDYTQVTTAGALNFQFRDSTGVISTSTYLNNHAGQYESSGVATFAGFNYQRTPLTSAFICNCAVGSRAQGAFDIINPMNSAPATAMGQWTAVSVSATLAQVQIQANIAHNASVARTGLRLSTGAGTVTGKFSLYGYRN
jgi:hypothetical protein